jgi:hypothetical protein
MKARPTVRKPRTMGHPSGGVLGLGSLRDESLAVMRVANTKTRTKHGAPGRFMSLGLLLSLAPHSLAQEPQPACVLEVPVYDPSGGRLAFRVIRVSPADHKDIDLLSTDHAEIRATASGDKIFFSSKRVVGREIQVTLQDPKGATVNTQFIVTSCRLRRSLFRGRSETGADVSGINVTGRLAGCNFEGDWWVRALPMFGGHDGSVFAVDGYVQPDGAFSMLLEDYGVRHLLVIGKGKQPSKVIGFDATAGKSADLGVINLSGTCPKP